jgi:hypothetical protein
MKLVIEYDRAGYGLVIRLDDELPDMKLIRMNVRADGQGIDAILTHADARKLARMLEAMTRES